MNEIYLGSLPLISFGFILMASYCYMLAGRSDSSKYHIGKWLRRFISPLFITLAAIIPSLLLYNFKWHLLLIYPLFVLQFHMGYTEYTLWGKIKRRGAIVLLNLIPILLLAFVYHNFWLMPLAIPFSLLSIYLGVKNFFHASIEEFMISFLLAFPIALYPLLL